MRQLSDTLTAHLAEDATTLCDCWVLSRADGVTLGFTDHDRTISVDGVICEPVSGFSASESASETGFSADNHEILGAIDDDRLTAEDLNFRRYNGADVSMYRVNWCSPSDFVLLRKGTLGEISREDGAFRAEVRSVLAKLDAPKGRVFASTCDAILGDSRCGVDLSDAAFSATATVIAARDRQTVEVSGLESYADQHFTHGEVEVLSGRLEGQKREIASTSFAGSALSLSLWTPFPAAAESGDQMRVYAGCDKRFDTCRLKFSNGDNFRGCPHMPGNDFVLSTVRADGNNDGGAR